MDKDFLKKIKLHTWAALLVSGFLGASLCFVLMGIVKNSSFTEQEFTSGVSMPFFLLTVCIFVVVILALMMAAKNPYPVYVSLFSLSLLCAYAMVLIAGSESYMASRQVNIGFMIGIGLVMVIILKYLMTGDKLMLDKLVKTEFCSSYKCMYRITWGAVVVFVILVSWVTVHRYLTFASGAFDFSIFAQMFEQMKTTGLPMTSLERGEALTHFAVHFSPSWYLLLPGYLIFSSPVYLYVVNALIIGLGAFPMFRIAKKLEVSPCSSMLFSILYLLFPAMAAGTLWDIHENSFLPVLLLYMVYFFLEEKPVPMFLFAVLTLGTKEDAAIYVIAFGLYVVFATKQKRTGVLLILLSVLYFLFAVKMVAFFGGTAMTVRYANLYTEGSTGFAGIVKTCITNIGYLIQQAFSLENGKLDFILWMLVPVLFAPFLSKKNSLLFLLMPMLLINLLSDWVYQYNIYFQYTYGPAALILVASVFAFVEWKKKSRRFFLITAFVLSLLFSGALFWSKGAGYVDRYIKNKQDYKDSAACIEEFLDEYYQEGDSVTAQGFLTSHLTEVDELYTLPAQYSENQETDWYLLHEGYQGEEDYPVEILTQYECVNPDASGFVRIYKKK